ncbi:MAG: energy transducer TonB [Halioglobus sp.]
MNTSIYAKPVMPRIIVRPALATLLLHALLIYVLTANWASMDRERIKVKPAPQVINARLVAASELQSKPKPKQEAPKPKPEPPKPKPEPPKPKPEPPKPKPEPPKPKPEPPKPKPEPPKPKAETPKPKPAPAKPAPEPAKPTPSQQSKNDALARIAQEELASSQPQQAPASAAKGELSASFVALIQRTIVNYWSRPPSARNGMECKLMVQLVPTGEVVGVTVIKSSGNAAFDSSAVNAVRKAGAFPELQQLPSAEFEKNFRRLEVIFRPEDLRY